MSEEQVVINKTEKPNSFEIGKAGARWKIYFSDAEDFHKQVKALEAKGYEVTEKDKK